MPDSNQHSEQQHSWKSHNLLDLARIKELEEQLEARERELQLWSVGIGPGPERMKELRDAHNPASEPLGLDQADADLAAGRARSASEVFAEIEAEQNQDRSQP